VAAAIFQMDGIARARARALPACMFQRHACNSMGSAYKSSVCMGMPENCMSCVTKAAVAYAFHVHVCADLPGWMWLFILEGAATVLFGLALRVRAQPPSTPSLFQCRLVPFACAAPVSPTCSRLLGLQTRVWLVRSQPALLRTETHDRVGLEARGR